jgi:hypothetical protein
MNLKTLYFPNICFPDESLKLIVLCQHIVILERGMFLTNIDFLQAHVHGDERSAEDQQQDSDQHHAWCFPRRP